jgi:predicted porin
MLAIGLAAGPALAQEGSTQIYGTFNVDVESVSASNLPTRTRVSQNSSNIGFRGTEKLAGGLTAFWQVESGAPVDAGNGAFASRNSAAGLKGLWGSLFLGQWDTPYKSLSGAVDPMYFTGITYTGALIGTPGFGVGPVTIGAPGTSGDGRSFRAASNASFERRQGNSVQYWTPTVAGVTARAAYSVNENRASSPSTPVDPYILSGSIEYEPGMFYFAYAQELLADYFGLDIASPAPEATPIAGAQASSRDRGHKLVARVRFGGTQLGLMGERLTYTRSSDHAPASALTRYQRDAIALTLRQRVGESGMIRGLVGRARAGRCERADGSACSTQGLGARQVSLGYSYSFSKRTDLYAFYTRVGNDSRATYQFANAAGIGAGEGAASVGYALGTRHTF